MSQITNVQISGPTDVLLSDPSYPCPYQTYKYTATYDSTFPPGTDEVVTWYISPHMHSGGASEIIAGTGNPIDISFPVPTGTLHAIVSVGNYSTQSAPLPIADGGLPGGAAPTPFIISGPTVVCKNTAAGSFKCLPDLDEYSYKWTGNCIFTPDDTSSETNASFFFGGSQKLTCEVTGPDGYKDLHIVEYDVTVNTCSADPCAGVTCPDGYYCVNGACQKHEDAPTCGPTTIGNTTITGPNPVCMDQLVGDYIAEYDGTAVNVSYAWTSSDGGAQFTDPDKASTKVVFSTAGNHTVDCTITNLD